MSYMYNSNDIFSSSFGPVDTGNFNLLFPPPLSSNVFVDKTVGARGTLTAAAMRDGVANGRNGKGTIYVFAAGNGGMGMCACVRECVCYLITLHRWK